MVEEKCKFMCNIAYKIVDFSYILKNEIKLLVNRNRLKLFF